MSLDKIEARESAEDLALLAGRLLDEIDDDHVATVERLGGGTNVILGEEALREIIGRAWMMGAQVVMNTSLGRQPCRVCGCWEQEACEGGCGWAEPGLCSACAPLARLTAA